MNFLWLSIFNFCGKPLNLISLSLIAYFFGADYRVDAVFWSVAFINYVHGILLRSWQYAIVPVYIKIKNNSTKEALSFATSLLTLGVLTALLTSGVIYFFSEAIIDLLTFSSPDFKSLHRSVSSGKLYIYF